MNFKMRVFFYKSEGIAEELVEVLSREYRVKGDPIPPSFPVEGEKLIIIGIDAAAKKPAKPLEAFCSDLTPARCKNVAFFVTNTSAIDAAKALGDELQSRGVNVVGDPYLCPIKGGLFGKGKLAANSADSIKTWSLGIIDEIHKEQ